MIRLCDTPQQSVGPKKFGNDRGKYLAYKISVWDELPFYPRLSEKIN